MPWLGRRTPDPQLLVDAQWALVGEIEQTAASSYVPAERPARQLVEELLRALRAEATTPEQWADRLARNLLAVAAEALANRQSLAALRTQLDWLEGLRRTLQAQVDAHNASPLAAQVQALTAHLQTAEASAAQRAAQVRDLQTALAGQAKTYEAEIGRLQGQIADLNRIVGSQQRKLNDLLAPPD